MQPPAMVAFLCTAFSFYNQLVSVVFNVLVFFLNFILARFFKEDKRLRARECRIKISYDGMRHCIVHCCIRYN